MSLDLDLICSEFNLKVDKSSDHKIYVFEQFRLDAVHLMLYRENEEVQLAPKAVETLVALVEGRGKILTKDELMASIWTDSIVEESNLAQYLHVLRKTLGNRQNGKPFIETLRRRGYRFNGDVTVSKSAEGSAHQRNAEEIKSHLSDDDAAFRINRKSRSVGVERRGNVLAIADWRERERDLVEGHIDARQPRDPFKARPVRTVIVALAVILLAALPFVWLKFASNRKPSAINGDLTVLNLTSGEHVEAATISPDGNYFVYASHDGEKAHLWLQQTGQATRQEIISPFTGAIYGSSFTPDSQFVYFVARESPDVPSTLYRVPALGGVHSKILTQISNPVSFSPDGSEMVFSRLDQAASQTLVIASSNGARERVLLTRTGDEGIGYAAWSPDGKLIAYRAIKMADREGTSTIVGIDPKTGETKLLSPEKWNACFRMAWTHDGQGLVFVGTRSKDEYSTRRDQIYYLSIADGEARRITSDGSSRHQSASLGVTDKDEILAVPFNRLSQIWAMDAGGDSRTAVQITTGFADGRGGIEPLADGRVAYLTRNGDGFSIWLMRADGTDRNQLTTDPSEIEELRAAPDGRYFVFSATTDGWSHLFRVDSAGGKLKQLTFGDSQEIDSTISPDGNWIVYDSFVAKGTDGKRTLWKIPSDGGEPVSLGDLECGTPHFSPDGRFVSCVSADWKKMSIVSVEDGTTIRTVDAVENPVLNIGSHWTPDGKALAYIVLHKNVGNILIQPIDSKAPRHLTDFTSGDMYNFAFSDDGARLYVARGYSTRNAILIKNFK